MWGPDKVTLSGGGALTRATECHPIRRVDERTSLATFRGRKYSKYSK